MIDVNELRSGVTFELDGELFKVVEYSHHKPGRGKATIRTRVRNLRTGAMLEKSFISSDKVQDVRLDYRQCQFLYTDGSLYHFMDNDTYEQPALPAEAIGDAVNYLKENMEVKLTFYEAEPLDIDLPTTVDLEIVDAEMAVKAAVLGRENRVLEMGRYGVGRDHSAELVAAPGKDSAVAVQHRDRSAMAGIDCRRKVGQLRVVIGRGRPKHQHDGHRAAPDQAPDEPPEKPKEPRDPSQRPTAPRPCRARLAPPSFSPSAAAR